MRIVHLAALLLCGVSAPGCFGACNEGACAGSNNPCGEPEEPDANCEDDAPGGVVLKIGRVNDDDELASFSGGQQIYDGPQGGSHFYYDVHIGGAKEGDSIIGDFLVAEQSMGSMRINFDAGCDPDEWTRVTDARIEFNGDWYDSRPREGSLQVTLMRGDTEVLAEEVPIKLTQE